MHELDDVRTTYKMHEMQQLDDIQERDYVHEIDDMQGIVLHGTQNPLCRWCLM